MEMALKQVPCDLGQMLLCFLVAVEKKEKGWRLFLISDMIMCRFMEIFILLKCMFMVTYVHIRHLFTSIRGSCFFMD